MSDTNLTPSVVLDRFSRQMTRLFASLRDELAEPSDESLAQRLELPTTYVHWLGGRRFWTLDGAAKVLAGGKRHFDEGLRLAGDPDEVEGGFQRPNNV